MNTVRNIVPLKGCSSSFISNLGKKAVIALATLIPLESATSSALAENKPEKEKAVAQFGEKSWNILRQTVDQDPSTKGEEYIWNNIISTLIVGDDTDISSLDNTRNEILSLGKDNPEIPINVLQSAIYSAGKTASVINKKLSSISQSDRETQILLERKNNTLKLVLDYINVYPIDTVTDKTHKRTLVSTDKVHNVGISKVKNFQETVSYAVAQLASTDDISYFTDNFFNIKEENLQKASNLLDIFNYLPKNNTISIPNKFLDNLNSDTIKNHLNKNTEWSNEERTYIAKSILLLAQADHENAHSLCKRWFEIKSSKIADSEADFLVLKALTITSNTNKEAVKTFQEVAISFSGIFFDAYFHACQTNVDSPQRQAGQEIINFFNNKPEIAHETFELSLKQEEAFTKALIAIASLHNQDKYTDVLRNTLTDDKEKEDNKVIAMLGLIKARDKDSIPNLLNIALNELNSQHLRTNALKAILLLDSPERFHSKFLEKLYAASPFTLDLSLFGEELSSLDNERYLFRISSGKTEENTIYSFVKSLSNQYGGSKGYLRELGSSTQFKEKYLTPLIEYLNDCKSGKRIIDLKLAHLMIYVLGKSNTSEASELLADIATYPELYIRKAPSNQITSAKFSTTNTVFIKMLALSSLGDVVNLHDKYDPGAKVLHTVSRFDSSSVYYTLSDSALLTLSKRFTEDSKEEVIEHHKSESIKNLLEYINKTGKQKVYADWYTETNRAFVLSLTVAKLGGAKDLLRLALDTSTEDPKSNIIRAIMHSLCVAKFNPTDIETLGFNKEDSNKLRALYTYIVEEEFWTPSTKNSGLTGKGVQVAVIDGGYMTAPKGFYPNLEDNITVPSEFVGLHDPDGLLSRHAHSVIGAVKKIAPDVEIISLTWDDVSPVKPSYRPAFLVHDNTVATLEHLVEGIIEGRYNPQLANCSFGIKGYFINTKEDGEKVNLPNLDLRSAMLELLANTGTLPIITIGNDYGNYPGDSRNGDIGEFNALGMRFLGNGKFLQPNNIIHVSTLDEFNGSIAPFNAIQDPLRTDAKIKSIGVHGTLILPSFYVDRSILENKPGSGSSFAAPRLTGTLSRFLQNARILGTSLTPYELRDAVFDTAQEIPDTRYFEVRQRLIELLNVWKTTTLCTGCYQQIKLLSVKLNMKINAQKKAITTVIIF
ncbi:MAG: hypothetical protein HYZ79_01940 [Candidatus Melainabacteria bacterium]|nr:hypothetical protein [Candidatus Melainabacteria bacterium]